MGVLLIIVVTACFTALVFGLRQRQKKIEFENEKLKLENKKLLKKVKDLEFRRFVYSLEDIQPHHQTESMLRTCLVSLSVIALVKCLVS
jgi:hypothetical protein